MSLLKAGKVFPKLISLIILIHIVGYAQKQARTIDKLSWESEPVRIIKVKTNGRPIELNKNFEEDDDWLSGLAVTVQNLSDKAIARIVLDLRFPRPETSADDKPTYVADMVYGRDPADDGAMLKLVQPKESVDVKLLDANLPLIQSDLKSLGYPEKITHTRILIRSVTFSDGSMWSGGEILYPDPANPHRKTNPKFPNKSET